MPAWPVPDGTSGGLTLIRTNLVAAREDPRECPWARSTKARPLLRVDPKLAYVVKQLQDFALAPLMDALDRIEYGRCAPKDVVSQLWSTQGTFGISGRPRAHEGLLGWTVAAISHYLGAREADQRSRLIAGLAPTFPVEDTWVFRHELARLDSRGANAYEETAWGRRYVALDGSVRDLWLISFGSTKTDRPASEKAAAAHVALYGAPSDGGGAGHYRYVEPDRLHPGRTAVPSRVRVLDVGCGDGSLASLVDWDREEVDHHFVLDARPALARVVDDAETRPGSSCVECKALAGCSALVRTPHLLSIGSALPKVRSRRSVSVADLRTYADCPAKCHVTRQLKLKSSRPENASIRRGRAVDAWLNDRHLARPPGGCRSLPGPVDSASWSAGDIALSGDEAEQGARMLVQHQAVCPLDGLDSGEQVLVQHQVTCYDPHLDLVFIATPDLLHTRAGGWTWRETKTSSSRLYEGEPLLRRYPQLALAVLMLDAGVLGGDLSRSLVEFELLNTDDSDLEVLDPSRVRVVSEARDVLNEIATPWIRDAAFEPNPGRNCQDCEALDWCVPGQQHLAASIKPKDR